MQLGWAIRIVTLEQIALAGPQPMAPGSIGVRLAGIGTADGLHYRSGLNPALDDESDEEWWKAQTPQSRFLVGDKNALVGVLEEPETAIRKMLLCPPVGADRKIPKVDERCTFSAEDVCRCELKPPGAAGALFTVSLGGNKRGSEGKWFVGLWVF